MLHILLSPLFLGGKNMGHWLCAGISPRCIKKITITPSVYSQTQIFICQNCLVPPLTQQKSTLSRHPSEHSIHRNNFSVDKRVHNFLCKQFFEIRLLSVLYLRFLIKFEPLELTSECSDLQSTNKCSFCEAAPCDRRPVSILLLSIDSFPLATWLRFARLSRKSQSSQRVKPSLRKCQ